MGPHRYRIIVSGRLGKFTREVFEDLYVESDGPNTGLTGELDQAALYGVLNRLQAFGLELVALSRLDEEPAETGPAHDVPPAEAAVSNRVGKTAAPGPGIVRAVRPDDQHRPYRA
jgi:hypothetical protein